jgi:hypothetical protein
MAERIEKDWGNYLRRQRTTNRQQLLQDLNTLRTELARHFAEESEGGCLDEAISHQPCAGRKADLLEHEHPDLLAELDSVIQRLEKHSGQSTRLHIEFQAFAQRLKTHEQAEMLLVATALGVPAD